MDKNINTPTLKSGFDQFRAITSGNGGAPVEPAKTQSTQQPKPAPVPAVDSYDGDVTAEPGAFARPDSKTEVELAKKRGKATGGAIDAGVNGSRGELPIDTHAMHTTVKVLDFSHMTLLSAETLSLMPHAVEASLVAGPALAVGGGVAGIVSVLVDLGAAHFEAANNRERNVYDDGFAAGVAMVLDPSYTPPRGEAGGLYERGLEQGRAWAMAQSEEQQQHLRDGLQIRYHQITGFSGSGGEGAHYHKALKVDLQRHNK